LEEMRMRGTKANAWCRHNATVILKDRTVSGV
jgi:hypothetical protein